MADLVWKSRAHTLCPVIFGFSCASVVNYKDSLMHSFRLIYISLQYTIQSNRPQVCPTAKYFAARFVSALFQAVSLYTTTETSSRVSLQIGGQGVVIRVCVDSHNVSDAETVLLEYLKWVEHRLESLATNPWKFVDLYGNTTIRLDLQSFKAHSCTLVDSKCNGAANNTLQHLRRWCAACSKAVSVLEGGLEGCRFALKEPKHARKLVAALSDPDTPPAKRQKNTHH